ncbi:MAG TPA: glucokinase [Steroidobacteraceae bacterium]|nr:glucokinase [Steroidobacteraceae bacterium]
MSTGLPSSSTTRLIADIGGTNARFALYRGSVLLEPLVLACADFPSPAAAAAHYLGTLGADHPRPTEAAFAIAGPITGDLVVMTNHVWRFSLATTKRELGLQRLFVMNDFTALAMAVPYLPADELDAVGLGQPVPDAPIALIGPGTGLGVSGLLPIGMGSAREWLPLQGEGGHSTMPAMNDREAAVLAQLRHRFTHVSAERVISGPGLVNVYNALCALEGKVPEPLEPAEVTQRALQGRDLICREALDMVCAMLGTVAGNLVLMLGAFGGVYIGGGIVPKLGRMFASSPFRDRFEDKGRYSDYLARVPSYVIRTEHAAFIGLAHAFSTSGPRIEAE